MSNYILAIVTLTMETLLDFLGQYLSIACAHDPISSMTTYTGILMMIRSRVGPIFHVGLTHETIDNPVSPGLVLRVGGVRTDTKDASVGGETEATIGVVIPSQE